MNSHITLSQAIEGYLLDARARQLSSRTIDDYVYIFRRLQGHVGDVAIAAIKPDDIRRFLADLRSHRVTPDGVAPRPPRVLSKKTIRNHYIALASLWTWATSEDITDRHVVRAIDPPAIEPFSKADVELLLKACETTRSYTRPGKRECVHRRPTAGRDRAIILLLLDTGARASEVCAEPRKGAPGLLVGDVDQRNSHITVMGKGDKGRILPISAPTAKAIWRYLTIRPQALPTNASPCAIICLLSICKRPSATSNTTSRWLASLPVLSSPTTPSPASLSTPRAFPDVSTRSAPLL